MKTTKQIRLKTNKQNEQRGQKCSQCRTHQLPDLALQVEDAVELSLAAPLRRDAVLAAPPHVVDVLELLRGQFVHFHQHLEVVAWKICDLVDGERQLNLQTTEKKAKKDKISINIWLKQVARGLTKYMDYRTTLFDVSNATRDDFRRCLNLNCKNRETVSKYVV